MKKIICMLGFFVMILLIGSAATATELIYAPINPSFGGSPLNSSWLLQLAQIQNEFKELRQATKKTPLEKFTEQLEYRVFNQIADRIVKSAFGEEALQPGEYTLGDYIINVSTGIDGITVVIIEISTGNSTTIQIPYY